MKCLTFILLSFIIISCNTKEDTANLSIKVIGEYETDLPLSKIKLCGQDTIIETKTNLEGEVELQHIVIGEYTVDVLSVGHYTIKSYSINIDKDQYIIFTMKSVDLKQLKIEWEGGLMTYEDDSGKVKTVVLR